MNGALNRTGVVNLTNKSGGSLAYGAVVILGTATANAFTTTTTSGYKNSLIGVVLEPAGIANNASGKVGLGIWVKQLNLASSASLYDFIKCHTVAGQGTPHAAPMQTGDFAIALETGTTPAAVLFGAPNQASFDASVVDITGTLALSGDISPSQITSNQNDYNPTGLSTAAILRLSSDASRNITGLQGGADGRIIVIVNVGSNNIVLKDSSGSSSAANQFALSGDITLAGDDGCILQYDSTSSRWRCIAKTTAGGGAAGSLVFINGQTPTSVASCNITSGIDSTYDEYEIHFDLVPATDAVTLNVLMSTDGGSSWLSSNYKYAGGVWYSSAFAATVSSNSASSVTSLGGEVGNASGEHISGVITLRMPHSTTLQKLFEYRTLEVSQQPYFTSHFGVGGNTTLSAVNAIQLKFSSGNIASGWVRLYGIAKS